MQTGALALPTILIQLNKIFDILVEMLTKVLFHSVFVNATKYPVNSIVIDGVKLMYMYMCM